MLRQVAQRLVPAANAVNVQIQRNIGVSAPLAQSLDPIQQLFVDKIREYRTKSAGGKLVDATPATEATLNDMLVNLERGYGAKGVDMTQFPTLNFAEPTLVWPGLTEDQTSKMLEAAEAAEQADVAEEEEEAFDPFEGIRMM